MDTHYKQSSSDIKDLQSSSGAYWPCLKNSSRCACNAWPSFIVSSSPLTSGGMFCFPLNSPRESWRESRARRESRRESRVLRESWRESRRKSRACSFFILQPTGQFEEIFFDGSSCQLLKLIIATQSHPYKLLIWLRVIVYHPDADHRRTGD